MWQGAKNIYHLFQGILALFLYGSPARGLTVIGVTGTDGKTTTANLIYHILYKAGKKVAVISTTGAIINGKSFDTGFHISTPGRFAIQSYLKKAKKAGAEYVILEMTSHGLHQHRAYGVKFAVGILTNITHDHLDYHKTYERYVAAKAKLLKNSKIAVVNKDDRSYKHIMSIKTIKHMKSDKRLITYGFKNDSDINLHNFHFKTKLIGKFNQYNCLAAIVALQQLNISDETIRKGIADFKAPVGRQDMIYDKDFKVIVDFATTENSFTSVLPEIKKITHNRLIHMFSSAGERDFTKRPVLGNIASQYAEILVLTAEDPRSESIEKIMDQIAYGVKDTKFEFGDYQKVKNHESKVLDNKKYIFKIPDRKEAVFFAISLAKKGDTVLLTGKGHEKSINYGRGEEPWDETGIALAAIRQRLKQ